MLSATIWILIFAGGGYRPAVVIDKFDTQAKCEATLTRVVEWQNKSVGNADQKAFCLQVSK